MGNQWSLFCISFCVSIVMSSCGASKLPSYSCCDCLGGLNKTDKNGRQVGYWKQLLPDSNGHFRIVYEGIYFHGRQVGTWKRSNLDGSIIYQQRIFMDTAESAIQESNYDPAGRMVSTGMLRTVTVKDSLQTIDLKTNKPKWDTVVNRFVKDGYWQYFWPNGRLKAAGHFKNDSQRGKWIYYNETGELAKTEEY